MIRQVVNTKDMDALEGLEMAMRAYFAKLKPMYYREPDEFSMLNKHFLRNHIIFAAYADDKRPIGMLICTDNKSAGDMLTRPQNEFNLTYLYVMPEYRCHGIGKALVTTAMVYAKGHNYNSISTNVINKKFVGTLKNEGFKVFSCNLEYYF